LFGPDLPQHPHRWELRQFRNSGRIDGKQQLSAIAADLVVPDNITLVPLPPYAPELNPVENVWEYLRGNKLSITVYDDYEHILDASCEAWMFFANDKQRVASITTRHWAQVNL